MDIASLGIKIQTQGAKEAAADLDKLQTSATRAEASVKKIGPSARTSSEALALFAKIDPAAGKLAALDSLEASLTRLSKAGKVGADDFAAMNAKLAESRAKIVGEGAAVAEATTLVQKFTSNTRLMSEASTIASDVVSGQFGRIRRSAAAMANASGVFRLAFTGTGALIAAAAGAVLLLGEAWAKAERESEGFNRAIIETGNNARLSVQSLREMAAELDSTTHATAGKASEVLAEVASTGQFTSEQIKLISEAALRMQESFGTSISTTVKQFEELAKSPVDAIIKLNEAQHFLTQATLDQIRQLQAQGKEADAAAVAIRAYADVLDNRAKQMEGTLSEVTLLWRDLKNGAAETFDKIVDGFRDSREAANSFKGTLNGLLASMPLLQQGLRGISGLLDLQHSGKQALSSVAQSTAAANANTFNFATASGGRIVTSDMARAQEQFDKEGLRYATDRARMEKEIADARALGLRAGESELAIEQRVKDIRASYADKAPKVRTPRAPSNAGVENASDRFDDMVGRFRSELDGPLQKAEETHLRNMRELTEAATKGKRSHEELANALALEGQAYAKLSDDVKAQLATQAAAHLGPIAQAENAHANALRDIDKLTREGALSATQHAKALDEEARAYAADMVAAKRAQDPMAAMLDDMRFEASLLKMTNAERETAIQLRELERQGIKGSAAELLEQNKAYEQQKKAIQLMDQFRSSAASALSDFVTGAKSAKDALKEFFNTLAQEITNAIAKHWMEQLFGQQGQSGGGQYGGALQGIFSLFGGGSANGNAFDAGVQVQAFATGGVVNSPTMFGMAGNRWGLMGEAGPEAILPLHRGPDGKLGVRMAANDDMPRPLGPAVVNQTVIVQGVMDSRTPSQLAQATAREQNRAAARNR